MRRLKMGMKGVDVGLWQDFLIQHNLLGAKGSDGDFGKKTDAATREFQKPRGLDVDGIVGPDTVAAARPMGFRPVADVGGLLPAVMADDTLSALKSVHPILAERAVALINRVAQRGTPIISVVFSGFRSFEEQQVLFNKGRTTPGPIVTNARPGESYHNYGLAVDIHTRVGSKINFNDVAEANIRGPVGTELGLMWGGNFAGDFKDRPHFQLTAGLFIRDLLSLFNKGGQAEVANAVSERFATFGGEQPPLEGDEVE